MKHFLLNLFIFFVCFCTVASICTKHTYAIHMITLKGHWTWTWWLEGGLGMALGLARKKLMSFVVFAKNNRPERSSYYRTLWNPFHVKVIPDVYEWRTRRYPLSELVSWNLFFFTLKMSFFPFLFLLPPPRWLFFLLCVMNVCKDLEREWGGKTFQIRI